MTELTLTGLRTLCLQHNVVADLNAQLNNNQCKNIYTLYVKNLSGPERRDALRSKHGVRITTVSKSKHSLWPIHINYFTICFVIQAENPNQNKWDVSFMQLLVKALQGVKSCVDLNWSQQYRIRSSED